jgi:hypothetical protein
MNESDNIKKISCIKEVQKKKTILAKCSFLCFQTTIRDGGGL